MELTQSYKNKAAINSPRTSLRQTVLTFINKNADVFEALTRSAYPFSSNGLPLNRYATDRKSVRNADDSLTRVQQQVDELTRMVNRLSNQINAIQPVGSPAGTLPNQSVGVDRSAALSNEIGINRFRALQAKPLGNR